MKNIQEQKGFTLIELLIVVAIIGILAAIAIPGYIGMQEKARKGAIQRSATSVVPELQAWLQSARSQLAGTEIDTDFNGSVEPGVDKDNATLYADGVADTYATNRQTYLSEKSPWDANKDLWIPFANDDGSSGDVRVAQITISSTTMGLRIIARGNGSGVSNVLVNKVITAD